MKLSDLKVNPKNPQKFGDLSKLQRSIKEFPKMMKLRPMVYDPETMEVLGGNKRLICLQKLKYKEIPDEWVVSAAELTKEEMHRFIIADNVGFGEWDQEVLDKYWSKEDYEAWGLETNTDTDQEPEQIAKEDGFEMPEKVVTTIALGDILQIGRHRLICGDARSKEDAEKLFGKDRANLILTDPPYNVDYTGGTQDKLKIQNDRMSDSNFYEFLHAAYETMFENLMPGGAFYIFHADSEGYNFRRALKTNGIDLKQTLVWVKNSMVMGRQDYQWKHEPILYGWKPGLAHYFFDDRTQTTVIDDKVNLKKLSKDEMLKMLQEIFSDKTNNSVIYHDKPLVNDVHPTMKPVSLMGYFLRNSSKQGQIVNDNFLGSGSTMVAAEQMNRTCYGMELDPIYCQVIVDRMRRLNPTIDITKNGIPH